MFLIRSSYFVLKDHLFIVSLLFLFVFSLLWLKTFISLSTQLGKGKEETSSGQLIAMSLGIQLAQGFLCLETFFTLGWNQICRFSPLYDLRTLCQTNGLQTSVCFRITRKLWQDADYQISCSRYLIQQGWSNVVWSLSYVQLFETLWTAACQASWSFTVSQSLFTVMSIELVMPSTISSSVAHFPSCLQSFPASGSFPVNWLCTSGGQSIGT